ncbi:MAG: hypothetical protein R3C30_03820 [Hyphomonadaceae bacterium]
MRALADLRIFDVVAFLSVLTPIVSLLSAENIDAFAAVVACERSRFEFYFNVATAAIISLLLGKLLCALSCPFVVKKHKDSDAYRTWLIARLEEEEQLNEHAKRLDDSVDLDVPPTEARAFREVLKEVRQSSLAKRCKELLDSLDFGWDDEEYRRPVARLMTAALFAISGLSVFVFVTLVLPDSIHLALFGEGLFAFEF